MKKQIIAVLTAVAFISGSSHAVLLDQPVVTAGPVDVTLTGTTTGTDGVKTKLAPLPLQFVQVEIATESGGLTNIQHAVVMATSLVTTNYIEIDGATTNTLVVLNDNFVSATNVFVSPLGSVTIQKGSSTAVFAVLVGSESVRTDGSSNAVLFIDAKLKTDKQTGDLTGGSAKVSGIWQEGRSILKGSLK